MDPRIGPSLRLAGGALGFPSPFAYQAGIGYWQMSFLYDTLLWADNSGRLLGWLAESYQRSADARTYSFVLRSGLHWRDGVPLTSGDVAFTFEYFAAHRLGPLVVAQPEAVAGVRATGPRQVEITLRQPDVTFAGNQAGAVAVVPRHIWSKVRDPASIEDVAHLVGSGPYRLTHYEGNGGPLLYESNDSYFLGRPFVRRIETVPVGDQLTSLAAGEIDAAETDVGGARPEVLAPFGSGQFGMVSQPGGFCFPLYFNLGRGGVPGDVRFRRACALAINRSDLTERLTGGNGTPGNPGFLAPSNPFYAPVEEYPFDLAGAGSLLDQMGYHARRPGLVRQGPGGELRVGLLYPTVSTALAEIVTARLEQAGIGVAPRGVELGAGLFGPKLAGDFDLAITLYPGPSGPGPNADPDLLRLLFSTDAPQSLNSANGYSNPQFDELANRQLGTTDRERRRALVTQMQQVLARDLPVLVLYYSTVFHLFRRAVFDQWYWTPGEYPVGAYNKQALVTGRKTGTVIRPEANKQRRQ